MEGIWAEGDCTTNSNHLKQVVTAASEGAVAANSIYMYLKEKGSN
jgi:thioredoxin reductase